MADEPIKKINELEEQTGAPADTDIMIVQDSTKTRKITFKAISDAIKLKLLGWTFDTLNTTAKKLVDAINEVDNDIGNISGLTTSNKSNLVGAVNELDSEIGGLNGLSTTSKNDLVSAVNELNGKMQLSVGDWTPVNGNFNGNLHKMGHQRILYIETGWLPWDNGPIIAGWAADVPGIILSKYAIMMNGSSAPLGICNIEVSSDTVITIIPPADWTPGASAHIRAWIHYCVS